MSTLIFAVILLSIIAILLDCIVNNPVNKQHMCLSSNQVLDQMDSEVRRFSLLSMAQMKIQKFVYKLRR